MTDLPTFVNEPIGELRRASVRDELSEGMATLERKPINDEWIRMFPDAATRPARQVMETRMEPGVLVQCDFLAVIGT